MHVIVCVSGSNDSWYCDRPRCLAHREVCVRVCVIVVVHTATSSGGAGADIDTKQECLITQAIKCDVCRMSTCFGAAMRCMTHGMHMEGSKERPLSGQKTLKTNSVIRSTRAPSATAYHHPARVPYQPSRATCMPCSMRHACPMLLAMPWHA